MHESFTSNISFYFKASRIHIFVNVLRGIGSPSRICFKIDETGQYLLLVPYSKHDFRSHPVSKEVYRGNDSMEVCSMKLCRIIAKLHGLDLDSSYRIPGYVDMDDKIAVFDLSKASLIRRGYSSWRR